MKKMDLFVDDGQFKIDDTNTILHFTATVDGHAQSFPTTDSLIFQIKKDNTYMQPAKGTASGDRVLLASEDLKHLAVGQYELELWHTNTNGAVDIFPDEGFLPIKINENAVGSISDEVSTITLQEMQKQLQSQINSQVTESVTEAVNKIPKPQNGLNGSDGLTPTIMVGNVSQLPAGSMPTVTDTGGKLDHVFNFGIPKAEITTDISTGPIDGCKKTAFYLGSGATSGGPIGGEYTLQVIGDGTKGSQLLVLLVDGDAWVRAFNGDGFKPWRQITQWN